MWGPYGYYMVTCRVSLGTLGHLGDTGDNVGTCRAAQRPHRAPGSPEFPSMNQYNPVPPLWGSVLPWSIPVQTSAASVGIYVTLGRPSTNQYEPVPHPGRELLDLRCLGPDQYGLGRVWRPMCALPGPVWTSTAAQLG